jgi:hypothetical protein
MDDHYELTLLCLERREQRDDLQQEDLTEAEAEVDTAADHDEMILEVDTMQVDEISSEAGS